MVANCPGGKSSRGKPRWWRNISVVNGLVGETTSSSSRCADPRMDTPLEWKDNICHPVLEMTSCSCFRSLETCWMSQAVCCSFIFSVDDPPFCINCWHTSGLGANRQLRNIHKSLIRRTVRMASTNFGVYRSILPNRISMLHMLLCLSSEGMSNWTE